ncbi:hypothetical protein F0562_004681 [Nyssa sinensis]|uniref:Gibberellin regulated protein n=1 Tax=Nyssa sinensis TaxID=561372 RepID=A0A5J5BYN9_9ASTE|nr:hypothetical protein F0562_004681 [Nyssa sinensis]
MLFLLASFLSVTTRVSSNDEEFFMEAAYAKVPAVAPTHSPVKAPAPAPAPPVKSPAPPLPFYNPPVSAPNPPTKTRLECVPLCVERCKLHSRKKICLRACMTCCNRCKCVPPGTYGNKEKCGKCYNEWTTRGGKPKCP